jgi:hypothetical protein
MRVANCVQGSSAFAILCRLVLRSRRPARTTPTPATAATVLRARLGGDAAEQRLHCAAHFLLHQVADHRQQTLLSRHRVLLRAADSTNARPAAKAVSQASQLQEKHAAAGGQRHASRHASRQAPSFAASSAIIFRLHQGDYHQRHGQHIGEHRNGGVDHRHDINADHQDVDQHDDAGHLDQRPTTTATTAPASRRPCRRPPQRLDRRRRRPPGPTHRFVGGPKRRPRRRVSRRESLDLGYRATIDAVEAYSGAESFVSAT